MRRLLSANTDLALIVLVMGVLVLLFVPIPGAALDVLLLLNFSLALLILLVTFYAPRPVDFSTFPAILLIATLFRLALNVSATRLILSEGDAGQVIGAVGSYVVGGNYVIGLIVFLILVVVQYVVVTSGAQRVSEVAARFTLDSMPGQQMSIDADLNMGLIDQEEAKRRRKNLEREAGFYGSMDGASKFVKGDAIAGILILLINIVGGLVIGVLQRGMPWGEAMRHYTLLTIGDGIVTQIPALVISLGTGLIVTRSSSDRQLGVEVLHQLTAFPRTLFIVSAVMVALAVLPGIPAWPALVIAAGAAATLYWGRARAAAAAEETNDPEPLASAGVDDPYAVFDLQALEVELGVGLAGHLGGERGVLAERMTGFRSQYASEFGLVVPKIRFRESSAVAADTYRITLFGEHVASGKVMVDHTLAIHPTGDLRSIPGIETREPTYGLPALWIVADQREEARRAKYTLVDPTTVVFTHLAEAIRLRASELLTRAEVERMLSRVRTNQPGLVEELVPTHLSVSDVQRVLQNLLRERVPIKHLAAIVEALLDGARSSKDPAVLTERARERLAVAICNSLSADRKTLHVLTLDPAVEDALLAQTKDSAGPRNLGAVDGVLIRLAGAAEKMLKANLTPVLLCAPEVRRQVRAICERGAPHLRVIAVSEVAPGFELRSFSSISAP
jgi:flagellar biosynthesis protein FlhA